MSGTALPSLVVAIVAVAGLGTAIQLATSAGCGARSVILRYITAVPVTLLGQLGPITTVKATYVPLAVVYAVGEVLTPPPSTEPTLAASSTASCPSLPPRLVGLTRKI